MAKHSDEKLYAVSHISFFDNDLRTVFQISSSGTMDAFHAGMRKMFGEDEDNEDMLDSFSSCSTLEEAKQLAFDQDSMVNVSKYSRTKAA